MALSPKLVSPKRPAALLALDAWCMRDIWRAWRPPHGEGQVVELPTRRVA
jgi:hypothetical protein